MAQADELVETSRQAVRLSIVDSLLSRREAVQLMNAIAIGYRVSRDHVNESCTAPVAKNLLPHAREAAVVDRVAEVAKRWDGWDVNFRLNATRNWSYLELSRGIFRLSCSFVPHLNAIPRQAVFRNRLAGRSQLDLFGNDEQVDPSDGYVYGIIVHGEHPNGDGTPGFVHIGFPDSLGKAWSGRPIDLCSYFRIDASEAFDRFGIDDEFVVDEVRPRLKQTTCKSSEPCRVDS